MLMMEVDCDLPSFLGKKLVGENGKISHECFVQVLDLRFLSLSFTRYVPHISINYRTALYFL